MSQAPVGSIAQLGVLTRVRGRERDRRQQAFIACRRDHDLREAELRDRQQDLSMEEQRHEAALRLRTLSPADALLGDYLIAQRSAVETRSRDEQQAAEAVQRSLHDLLQARIDNHRAQVRLGVLEDQLCLAQRHERRRQARKGEEARPEGMPADLTTRGIMP